MPVLHMTRRFDATPERLFAAWTDPRLAATWLFTEPGSEHHATELDVRVGGRWRILDRRDGVDYTALGEYLEVDRPARLVFTFGMPQFSPDVVRVTIEIVADGDGARMTLVQESVPTDAMAATQDGWRLMFEQLDGRLARS